MKAFYEHHQHNIRFGYRCFDRILLNGLIQPFWHRERVVGFSAPTAISILSAEVYCVKSPNNFTLA